MILSSEKKHKPQSALTPKFYLESRMSIIIQTENFGLLTVPFRFWSEIKLVTLSIHVRSQ